VSSQPGLNRGRRHRPGVARKLLTRSLSIGCCALFSGPSRTASVVWECGGESTTYAKIYFSVVVIMSSLDESSPDCDYVIKDTASDTNIAYVFVWATRTRARSIVPDSTRIVVIQCCALESFRSASERTEKRAVPNCIVNIRVDRPQKNRIRFHPILSLINN